MRPTIFFYFCYFFCFSFAISYKNFTKDDMNDLLILNQLLTLERHIFESKIVEGVNKVKKIISHGIPKKSVPPLDPFLIKSRKIDYSLNGSKMKGYLKNAVISKFGEFDIDHVEFKLLPLHFRFDISIGQLLFYGEYEMRGKISKNKKLNGTGEFIFDTRNITLSMYFRPTIFKSSLQIKDLKLKFETIDFNVTYTNIYKSDEFLTLENDEALHMLDSIQEKYIKTLIKTFEVIVNFHLLSLSFEEAMKHILAFINN